MRNDYGTCLHAGDAVEDDVEAARDDAAVAGLAVHRVRLARAGDAVGEQQAVLPVEHVVDERQRRRAEELLLRRALVEDASEGVARRLGGAAAVALRRLRRRHLHRRLVQHLDTRLFVGRLHRSQPAKHLRPSSTVPRPSVYWRSFRDRVPLHCSSLDFCH